MDDETFIFGSFRLIPAQRVLLDDGKPVRLGSRALDILITLVERTITEAQRLPVVEQRSLRWDQPERSEDEGFVIHRGTVLPAPGFIQRPLIFAKIDGRLFTKSR